MKRKKGYVKVGAEVRFSWPTKDEEGVWLVEAVRKVRRAECEYSEAQGVWFPIEKVCTGIEVGVRQGEVTRSTSVDDIIIGPDMRVLLLDRLNAPLPELICWLLALRAEQDEATRRGMCGQVRGWYTALPVKDQRKFENLSTAFRAVYRMDFYARPGTTARAHYFRALHELGNRHGLTLDDFFDRGLLRECASPEEFGSLGDCLQRLLAERRAVAC